MESASPCNSMIGHSLKWRCCSLVWPISLLTKTSFDSLKRDQSFFRLPAPYWRGDYTVYAQCTRVYTAVCTCYMSRGRQNNNGCPSPPFWRLHTFTLYFMTKQIWKNYSANCQGMRGRGVWCAHAVKHTYILNINVFKRENEKNRKLIYKNRKKFSDRSLKSAPYVEFPRRPKYSQLCVYRRCQWQLWLTLTSEYLCKFS